MKQKFEDLIKSCNQCILTCLNILKVCKKCSHAAERNLPITDLPENCSASCQKAAEKFFKCIHECNIILENKLYETADQEKALKDCIQACQESVRRCQESTNKILNKSNQGCVWSLDALDKCISACDLCIEHFER